MSRHPGSQGGGGFGRYEEGAPNHFRPPGLCLELSVYLDAFPSASRTLFVISFEFGNSVLSVISSESKFLSESAAEFPTHGTSCVVSSSSISEISSKPVLFDRTMSISPPIGRSSILHTESNGGLVVSGCPLGCLCAGSTPRINEA